MFDGLLSDLHHVAFHFTLPLEVSQVRRNTGGGDHRDGEVENTQLLGQNPMISSVFKGFSWVFTHLLSFHLIFNRVTKLFKAFCLPLSPSSP